MAHRNSLSNRLSRLLLTRGLIEARKCNFMLACLKVTLSLPEVSEETNEKHLVFRMSGLSKPDKVLAYTGRECRADLSYKHRDGYRTLCVIIKIIIPVVCVNKLCDSS